MAVRVDYKQTEVGVIPKDWDVFPLGEHIKITSGESPSKFKFSDIGMPYFKVEQLNNCTKYQKDTPYYIQMNAPVKANSIIFPKRGASIFLNKIRILLQDSYFDTNLMALTFIDDFDFEYMFYRLSYTGLDKIADTTSVPQINNKHINPFLVPIPPTLAEQTAIAAVLSDTDALIQSLDRLIDKKRLIKQGAMQELLTGKRRLPGFSGKWTRLTMTENSTLNARIGWQGLTTAEYKTAGEYFLVTGTDFKNGKIDWSNCSFVDKGRYSQDKNIQLKINDVLITKDGTIGKVGLVNELPGPATLNSGIFVVRPVNNAYDPVFLYYVLSSRIFDDFLTKLQAGSTIIHLYQKDFVSFGFMAPTLAEQTAIAAILSDMDAEIEALEEKRDKYKAVKQGMMQELLTGRIRLI